MNAVPPERKILSIDGGGIRGLIPALVLDAIEQRTGKAIADLFDVIAGTSTGGILALGLTCPGANGRPRYSAADLAQMYVQEGHKIFPHEIFAKVRQLIEPKYPAKGREEVLTDKLGEARLKDALKEVIVTAYDIEGREPIFFRSAQARESESHDYLARDVALATSAAPTYFKPVQLPSPEPGRSCALVDGGVFANNPGMCAFVDRTTVGGDSDRALMVSLGTGVLIREFAYDQAKGWGVVEWAPRILDVVFDGVSETVDHQLHTLLADRYYRLQVTLTKASDDMDDAGEHNIERLRLQAGELIEASKDKLELICEKLVA